MFKFIHRSSRKGFTLLELIIAVLILAVLAVIAIPTFSHDVAAAGTARDSTSLTSMATDAMTMAASEDNVTPSASDINNALGEMAPLPGDTSWSGVASTTASVAPSTAYGVVSYDNTDVAGATGYAMKSQSGGCVMDLTTGSTTVAWSSASASSACDGSAALAGETAGTTTSASASGDTTACTLIVTGVLAADVGTDPNDYTLSCTGVTGPEVDAAFEANGTYFVAEVDSYAADQASYPFAQPLPSLPSSFTANYNAGGAIWTNGPSTVDAFGISALGTTGDTWGGTAGTVGLYDSSWNKLGCYSSGCGSLNSGVVVANGPPMVLDSAAMSCANTGNCSVVGTLADNPDEAAVQSLVNGTWTPAQTVADSLNAGGVSDVASVSCPSVANCSAVGKYTDGSGNSQAFVVGEVGGVWGPAQQIGKSLDANGGYASLESVSCASAGNCAAEGSYWATSENWGTFVISEVSGTWGNPQDVAALLLTSDSYSPSGVTCTSAGNCSAGASPGPVFDQGVETITPFEVSEVDGVWGSAQGVSCGTLSSSTTVAQRAETYNAFVSVTGRGAELVCSNAGDGLAGGAQGTPQTNEQAVVINETNGVWGSAREVAGSLNVGGSAEVDSTTCTSAGNCVAGGYYTDASGALQLFIADEVGGVWGQAKEISGSLPIGQAAGFGGISCASADNCFGAGTYDDTSGNVLGFTVSEVDGVWGAAASS